MHSSDTPSHRHLTAVAGILALALGFAVSACTQPTDPAAGKTSGPAAVDHCHVRQRRHSLCGTAPVLPGLFLIDRVKAIVHHDDAEREWSYDRTSQVGRLDKAWDEAVAKGSTVVSMKDDWKSIFPR